ncbi:TetR/AcrR family transcriptional regulator [Gordonia sp. OPL2]|uniref:TetR/AcrR family transcriptional regulator n=1 Tax=Gordonia sp. OPL2 TaxID=2486274 RepID=UPI001655DC8F|nr:TetR/AcrR family transcriptional regulator [Gordonia sp. OPL2]ROZ99349.1 TetR/AcrR family transcriptional regulator [Gordonia sp. OPL2]
MRPAEGGDIASTAGVRPARAARSATGNQQEEFSSLERVFNRNVGRERILAAAVTIVATRGFGACTVREVAQAAGIKAPGLYSHFRSKEEILTEAVSRVLADFTENAAAIERGSPEEELRDTVRRHVLYQIQNVHLARVADMLLDTASAGDFVSHDDYERLVSQQRDYLELLGRRVATFAPTLPAPQVNVVAMAILAMCDRVAIWYDNDGPFTPDEVADLHWQLARRMVAE